jgi:hypothetical protein
MRFGGFIVLASAAALIAGTGAIAQQASPSSRIDLPTRQWVALDTPHEGNGISGEMKHVTGALNPDNGRIYLTGGDYSNGTQYDAQSYRQETWSLSLAERWKDRANPNAGWRLEYPYCGPVGQVQPKHPDFVGWTWDPTRKVFWMVPGVMEISPVNCPGETGARTSDPGFLAYRIMQFDPSARQWRDVSGNVGESAETWMSIYDPKTDTIIRFGHNGGTGALVSIYRIAKDRWVNQVLPPNALGRDIRINKEYLAVDYAGRVIYAIDGTHGRLHRYRMDSQAIDDLGPVPGGPNGRENYMYVAWDSTNKILLWFRAETSSAHAYRPDRKAWETIPLTTDNPGATVGGRTLVYDQSQNVFLLFGGLPANPHLFLFRYGEGS